MRVSILGTGVLGRAVAERLNRHGQVVTVYNRTASKTHPLADMGIAVAASRDEAVASSEVILLFLADAPAIRSLLFAPPAADLAGRLVVQMGTIGPAESRSFEEATRAAGGDYCEAPVLGSVAETQKGALLLLFGGTKAQLGRLNEVFRPLTQRPTHAGPVGKAAALKLALNQLIAAEIAAFSLSLGLVQREAIDVGTFMDVLRASALYAPTFEKKLPRLLARNYADPNFSTTHLLKDVQLILQEARVAGLGTAGLEGLVPLLTKAIDDGLGERDYSSIFDAISPRREFEDSDRDA